MKLEFCLSSIVRTCLPRLFEDEKGVEWKGTALAEKVSQFLDVLLLDLRFGRCLAAKRSVSPTAEERTDCKRCRLTSHPVRDRENLERVRFLQYGDVLNIFFEF
ncbi:hypothetical protein TNCV_585031 [Trichonephila clavipes]|nr:hypothetical protein TNCV_585031 [Trichonephila clavipes]